MKKILGLFLDFLKFGCFTFGGGWSIIAQMQKLYVEERKCITAEEILDMTSVGRSIPGTMIGNVALLFGYHMAGIAGGIACVVGMIIPPMVMLTILTWGYSMIQDNVWVMAAMSGVRSAIVPIIVSAVVGMVKGAFKVPPCYLILLGAVALYLFAHVNSVWIIVFGAVTGVIVSEIYERIKLKKEGTKR